MIICILLVLLLLISTVCLKYFSSDSSIGTFNYNLVRFFCDLFSPLVPNGYSCKDIFSFVSQIKNANLPERFLAS